MHLDSSSIRRNPKSSGSELHEPPSTTGPGSRTHVGADIITPLDVVRDLDVLLDTTLTMKKHISKITSVCFYHLQRLKQVRRLLGPDITARIISAFVLNRLDYCNSSWPAYHSRRALLCRSTKYSSKANHVSRIT